MHERTVRGVARAATPIDLLGVIAAGLFWGTGGLAGALLADRSGIDALAVAGYRLLIGGGLIVCWLLATGRLRALRIGRAGRRRLVALGILAAVFQSAYFAAVELTSVSLATLIALGSAPVLVILAESVLGRRRPPSRMSMAAAVALSGLTLLVVDPGAAGPNGVPAGATLTGAGCALASGGAFAAMTMLAARPVAGLPTLPTIGLAFCLGGLLVLPLAILLGDAAVELQPGNLGLLAYLGLVPTALAYTCYFAGLRSVPTPVAALTALLEPLTAAVLGALVLGDRLGPGGIVGALLIGLAVGISAVGVSAVGVSAASGGRAGCGPDRPGRTAP